ncbi:hypothetical protein FQA47_010653 [Oryzias melastigma]|uniref:Uncharacterized protein n=1 Tax=Oryzias melastigma TaxID=30732 RepID=A0A834F4G7_ORYME|nr:hypothetical protein FQA47_010653 [Oryzias melastigma]
MSVFHRLTPLLADPSASRRQTNEHPKVGLLPPLSSPVIKKKAIHIPSFNEKGLMFRKSPAADESFDLVSNKTPRQSWMREVRQKRENGQGDPTVHKIQSETRCSPRLPANPNTSILKSKPSDSSHSTSSQNNFYATLNLPQPKPRLSPTLTVPTSRRSPSQSSRCPDGGSREQCSPTTKERRAQSIFISNSRNQPWDEGKHEVLDQTALMDFTHSRLRVHRTESRRSSTSQNPCEVGMNEPENTAKDRPVRFVEAKSKIQQQQQESQRGDIRYTHRSEDQVFSVRGSVNPEKSFSSEPPPSFSGSGSRQLESTRVDAVTPSGQHQQENVTPSIPWKFSGQLDSLEDIKPPQNRRLMSKSRSPRMDTKRTESWSDCVSKGFNCQSRDIDQRPEAPLCPLTPGLSAPHSGSLQPGLPPNPDLYPALRKSHKEVRVPHLNQTGISQPPDLHAVPAKPPEHPWPPSVGHCPLITNSPSSKRVSDLHRTYQNPEEGAAPQQTFTGKVLFHEDSEDPYYVTMFHPGSVYVGEYEQPDHLNWAKSTHSSR